MSAISVRASRSFSINLLYETYRAGVTTRSHTTPPHTHTTTHCTTHHTLSVVRSACAAIRRAGTSPHARSRPLAHRACRRHRFLPLTLPRAMRSPRCLPHRLSLASLHAGRFSFFCLPAACLPNNAHSVPRRARCARIRPPFRLRCVRASRLPRSSCAWRNAAPAHCADSYLLSPWHNFRLAHKRALSATYCAHKHFCAAYTIPPAAALFTPRRASFRALARPPLDTSPAA